MKEFIFKIQQLQETLSDKEETLTQLQQTVEILTNDKKFLKKSYDSLMTKFKKIQEENILIPKKQGAVEEEKTFTQKTADDPG